MARLRLLNQVFSRIYDDISKSIELPEIDPMNLNPSSWGVVFFCVFLLNPMISFRPDSGRAVEVPVGQFED